MGRAGRAGPLMGVWPVVLERRLRIPARADPLLEARWPFLGVRAERDPGASCGQGIPALHLSLALNWVLGGPPMWSPTFPLLSGPQPCSRPPRPSRSHAAESCLLESEASAAVGQTDGPGHSWDWEKVTCFPRGGVGPEPHGEEGRPGWLAPRIGRITQFAGRGVCRQSLALSKELLPLPPAPGSRH